MRLAYWARRASMVLALKRLGSYLPISLNLVCTQPLPTTIKADGFADTAQKSRAFSPTALPSRKGGTPERASPLEGQG